MKGNLLWTESDVYDEIEDIEAHSRVKDGLLEQDDYASPENLDAPGHNKATCREIIYDDAMGGHNQAICSESIYDDAMGAGQSQEPDDDEGDYDDVIPADERREKEKPQDRRPDLFLLNAETKERVSSEFKRLEEFNPNREWLEYRYDHVLS